MSGAAVFADLFLQAQTLLMQRAERGSVSFCRECGSSGVLFLRVIRLYDPAVEQHQAHRQQEQHKDHGDQRAAADQLPRPDTASTEVRRKNRP